MLEWENDPHTHTHTHIMARYYIMTYHDSVLRYHTKISVQWTSKYINCFLKLSYVPARFNGNADLLTFTKLAILARGHP